MPFWDHQNQDKIVIIIHKALTRAVEQRKYKTKEVWQEIKMKNMILTSTRYNAL